MELDDFQTAVVESTAARLMVEAGPGSGKTTTIAARVGRMVREGIFAPQQVAVVTYTRSMALDLRKRVESQVPPTLPCRACDGTGKIDGAACSTCMGTGEVSVGELRVGTLHAIAAQVVRAELAREPGSVGRMAIEAMGWLRPDCTRPRFATDDDVTDLRKIAQGVVGKKVTAKALMEGLALMGPDLTRRPPEGELRRQLRIRDLMTYDDVLKLMEVVLVARSVAGDPLGHEIPCLVVDERQDLTDAHWSIIEAWGAESLTVVGDSAQAIFGFLGARERELEGFEALALGGNYRSLPPIVGHNNAVREKMAADGICAPLVQEAYKTGYVVTDVWRRTPEWQAPDIVECVSAMLAGYEAREIAVLAPTWAELSEIRCALESAGIDCDYPEAQADKLWSSVMGRGFVGACRAAAAGHVDEMDADLILRCFGSGLRAADLVSAAMGSGMSVAEACARRAGSASEADLWRGLEGADFARVVDLFEAAAPLPERVVDAARTWADGGDATCDAFVADLVGPGISEVVARPDGVALRTIHGAKGLEWPAVVVASACEGGLPTRWQKTPVAEAEGARMLYVALTRAAEALAVVSPEKLDRDVASGRADGRRPTRWL